MAKLALDQLYHSHGDVSSFSDSSSDGDESDCDYQEIDTHRVCDAIWKEEIRKDIYSTSGGSSSTLTGLNDVDKL